MNLQNQLKGESKNDYKVGDIIEFRLNYAGILTANTSKYVERSII